MKGKKERERKEERLPGILLPPGSLMSIAHAVMATISAVMWLMASETGHEKDVKIIVRFN